MLKQKCLYAKINDNLLSSQLSPLHIALRHTARYLSQAILLEVCCAPKPGLVTRFNNGSHNDMSIFTFAMSSAVLSKAFYTLQDLGMSYDGSPAGLFSSVREYGIIIEQELLEVTRGVNTQRGILFAGGVLCAAAGLAIKNNLTSRDVLTIVKKMTAGLVEKELASPFNRHKTAGEKLYRDFGITGIRGEIENGFPNVINAGLPALTFAFKHGAGLNDALTHTLIALMAVTQDSNIIWRSNLATADKVKTVAKKILARGSVFTDDGKKAIRDAEKDFISLRISPGGSADLLSITIALYLLENKEFPVDIL